MTNLFDNLYRYKRPRLYDIAKTRKDERLHQPYDYRTTLMNNSISRHILRNAMVRYFIGFINDYIYEMTNGIRYLKNYKNYTVKKDDKNVR
jgi:hypothetical protein